MQKKNILTLVLSEKKILNETKNHNPPHLFSDPYVCTTVITSAIYSINIVYTNSNILHMGQKFALFILLWNSLTINLESNVFLFFSFLLFYKCLFSLFLLSLGRKNKRLLLFY